MCPQTFVSVGFFFFGGWGGRGGLHGTTLKKAYIAPQCQVVGVQPIKESPVVWALGIAQSSDSFSAP